MNSTSGKADGLAHETMPLLAPTSDKVNALLLQGLDSVQSAGKTFLAQANHANDVTVDYIRKEPVKSVLVAAATGLLIGVLLTLVTRSRT
jgi:ElaB/YqjD/DUF883 family membrane-anchored ribosome-binding protein